MTKRNRIIAATLAAAIALPLMATAASRVQDGAPAPGDARPHAAAPRAHEQPGHEQAERGRDDDRAAQAEPATPARADRDDD